MYFRNLPHNCIHYLWLVSCISVFIIYASSSEATSGYDATIIINTNDFKKKVNRNLFGIALAKLHRQQWRPPVDLTNPNLKQLLEELSPTFITLDNTQLGLPFYIDSTGKQSERLSTQETLVRMNISRKGVAEELLGEIAKSEFYNKGQPPHKNYDDILQYFKSLKSAPEFAIRIPVFFTDVQGTFRSLDHKLAPETGVELIRYFNDPPDSKFGKLRAKNGQKAPYNIHYIVLGNELWANNMWEGLEIGDIADQIKSFSDEIKAIYPNIKLGVNFLDDVYPHRFFKPGVEKQHKKLINYNQALLAKIKDNIDFITFHVYGGLGAEDLNKPFSPVQWQYILSQNFLRSRYNLPEKYASFTKNSNPELLIAIDEYSGPTSTLGGAVYNADYLIHLLDNNYEYATGWSLGIMEPDNHFGIIGVRKTLGGNRYYRKPGFFALKLFTHYMKGRLTGYSIDSPGFSTNEIKWERYFNWPAEADIPSLSMVASRQGEKVYAIIVNRNIDKDIKTRIELEGAEKGWSARLFILSGSSLGSTQVEIVEKDLAVNNRLLNVVFNRHSVTAIEINLAHH